MVRVIVLVQHNKRLLLRLLFPLCQLFEEFVRVFVEVLDTILAAEFDFLPHVIGRKWFAHFAKLFTGDKTVLERVGFHGSFGASRWSIGLPRQVVRASQQGQRCND
jgi:hypothetical protein